MHARTVTNLAPEKQMEIRMKNNLKKESHDRDDGGPLSWLIVVAIKAAQWLCKLCGHTYPLVERYECDKSNGMVLSVSRCLACSRCGVTFNAGGYNVKRQESGRDGVQELAQARPAEETSSARQEGQG